MKLISRLKSNSWRSFQGAVQVSGPIWFSVTADHGKVRAREITERRIARATSRRCLVKRPFLCVTAN
jgi:hypothetical protein